MSDRARVAELEDELGYLYSAKADEIRYNHFDEWGDYGGSSSAGWRLVIVAYPILKVTPCGAWYNDSAGRRSFVNHSWRKRAVYRTEQEAIDGAIERKKMHVFHAKRRLRTAEQELAALTILRDSPDPKSRTLYTDPLETIKMKGEGNAHQPQ
jgi:hypothetical protein